MQGGAGESHHEHVHDRPGGSRLETELFQKHTTSRQETQPVHPCRVLRGPRPQRTDENDDQCREHGLAHHPRIADDARVTHLVELLRCDAGADKAMEATRGTTHNQREHHGKDGASNIDGQRIVQNWMASKAQ